MPHPNLDNETPFVVEPLLLLDEQGRPALTLVAKLSFEIGPGGALSLCEEQPALALAGELWFPDAELSSYRYEPEIVPFKPATDVAVIAEAHAPGRPAAVVDVGVSVGPLVKQARVFGDRHWLSRGLGELQLSPPQPFVRMALCYERAFGGTLTRADGSVDLEPRNPLGRGYLGQLGARVAGPAANIEDPRAPVTHARDRPAPMGFGFTSPNMQPRAALAGTYDAQWKATRAPLLPSDFQLGFYSAASPGLVAPGYLRGDEPVAALNLSPEGRLDFRLPGVPAPQLRVAIMDQRDQIVAPVLDTVILDLERRRLSLLWRLRLALPRGFHSFTALEVRSDLVIEGERAA